MNDMACAWVRGWILWLAAGLLPAALHAQPVHEFELKAAFVYNFALFTEWPAETVFEGGMLNICINPESALRMPLSGLDGKPVKGRRVAIRFLAVPDNARFCHVLFVDGSDRDRWEQMRKALGSASVLTVSDDEEIAGEGSMVALAMERKRVVFDIDTRAARQARLVLSSKLLRLARTVR